MTDDEALTVMLRAARTNYDTFPNIHKTLTHDMKSALTALKTAGWRHVGEGEVVVKESAFTELYDAIHFFDKVKFATQAEQIAVGTDHYERLIAAVRATINAKE